MMTFYDMNLSGHSHRVRALLSLLAIPHKHVEVDVFAGEHKSEEYRTINAFGQLPALDDDGEVLRDSNAILVYLAAKYDGSKTWLPTDPLAAARVQEWLAKSTKELALGPSAARASRQFKGKDNVGAQELSGPLLALYEAHLTDRTWFVGDNPTVADLATYAYVARAPEGGVSLTPYPAIRAWLTRVEAIENMPSMPRIVPADQL